MNTMSELLPCPFCGAKVMRVESSVSEYPFIVCENSHAWCPRLDTKAEAVEAWNTRADVYTREDVEGAFVSGYSLGSLPVGSDPQWNQNERTMEAEMAEWGWVRERTCKPLGTIRYDYESGYAGFEYETELSCGHKWHDSYGDYPNYCPSCGAKVVEE